MNDTPRQATRLEAIGGRFDPWLLGAMLALASLGVVMVASASIYQHGNPFYYLIRHGMFLGVGLGLAAWAMRTELKSIEHHNQLLLLACFVLLALVFVPGLGSSVNGARRWINLGVSKFQVVEAVKVLYIIWIASYLVRFRDEVSVTWQAMLKPVVVVGLLVGLLLLQPDFGSSMLLLSITACIYLILKLSLMVYLVTAVWVGIAALVYFGYSARNSRLEKPDAVGEDKTQLRRRDQQLAPARQRPCRPLVIVSRNRQHDAAVRRRCRLLGPCVLRKGGRSQPGGGNGRE